MKFRAYLVCKNCGNTTFTLERLLGHYSEDGAEAAKRVLTDPLFHWDINGFDIRCADCGGAARVEVYAPPQVANGGLWVRGRKMPAKFIRALIGRMHK